MAPNVRVCILLLTIHFFIPGMNPEPFSDEIPPMKPGQMNGYSTDDIKRWGVKRFLDTVCRKEPLPMPDFGFTDEENAAMDEILRREREIKDFGFLP